MTKRERERVRRAAAVIAIAPLALSLIDVVTNDDRDAALLHWRGDDAEGGADVGLQRGRSECGLPKPTSGCGLS
jgi:hypothetical protein